MSPTKILNIFKIPLVDNHLEQVGNELRKSVVSRNELINTAVKRLLKSPGKRLRSILILAIADSYGIEIDEKIILACTAIELVHMGSLVHDDIIDEASLRRGVSTINSEEGANQAIIIGDYLFAQAGLVASRINIKAVQIVQSAIISMCEGQSRELEDDFNIKRSIDAYLETISGKTAALFSACCTLAASTIGLSEADSHNLFDYGYNFGLGFQIIDDVIDLLSSPELSGKPAGNDIKEGVYTIPLILGLTGPNNIELKNLLKDKPSGYTKKIIKILFNDGDIKKSLNMAKSYNKIAVESLLKVDNASNLSALVLLPKSYLDNALTTQIAKNYKPELF
jgi:geranylgeranyl pyrophosphate synthase